MKIFLSALGIIAVVGLIAWGVWFFALSKNSGTNAPSSNGSLPAVPSSVAPRIQSQAQNGTYVFVQGVASPQNPDVAKDFLGEIQNADQIALGGTVVVSPYALQVWGDTNKGGEALLEYTSSTQWTLISLGGGEWTVLALVQVGVPVSVAQQLVAGLPSGSASSAVASPITIPAANTITIGTLEGGVVMNNFYKSAAYIDQDQQVVVIQQSSTYSIVYDVSASSFTLTLFGAPFETVRQTAEATFLGSLGISEQDACKLGVYEEASGVASAQYVGKSFPLSFCVSGGLGQ